MASVSPSPSDHHHDRLTRSVVAFVGWVMRHPWLVIAACLGLVAASAYGQTRLKNHTQRNDLLSAEKECQKRWQKYLDAFGDDDDMTVVVEGADRARMIAAVTAVAERVKQRPDLFDRVFHRADLRGLHDRALLFLPADQIEGIRGRVDRMEALLGKLAPLAWQRLNLQSLLGTAATTLESRAAGRGVNPADSDLLVQLPAVARSAANTVRDPAGYRNPWAVAGPRTADRGGEQQLTEPQDLFTPDGSLAILVCRPKKETESFTPVREASDAMRAILTEVGLQFPDLQLGLTGLPVLETDEMVQSDIDSDNAFGLALVGLVILYLAVYRGFRFPLLTVASLLTGLYWALGWATLTVGHLNILSMAFAVMLIGMGDYGVLWVAQYDEGRKAGKSIESAMRHAATHAGPSIVTASLTTALAFFATMLVDFKAVAELGWIAGSGVLFCAASCLTLMPATLLIVERIREQRAARRAIRAGAAKAAPINPDPSVSEEEGHHILPFPAPPAAWLPGLASRPRTVLAIGLVLLIGCGGFAARLGYDHNLLHLQARGLDSVAWEHKLIERSAGMTWDAMSIASTREEALALRTRYEALHDVSRVVEVASLVPADQEAKLPIVRAIHDRLANLLPADKLPAAFGSSPDRVRELAATVRDRAGSDTELGNAVAVLLRALDAVPHAALASRLQAFDRRLAADLAADLHRLKAVSHPTPITLTDLPVELRERYVGANGEFLVRAFARESLWDYPALQRFTIAAEGADPQATGKAFRTREGLAQMKIGFEWAGAYALAAIVVVLLLDFRRVADLMLVLFPLGVGVVLTLGVMGLCGVWLNPANMIALPLIVGVGVDNGVHVLHDYRHWRGRTAYQLGSATGRGVLVAALTTVLGFGTMMIARHRGMASLGLALTLGVTFCMVAALIWLPALLRLLDERRLKVATKRTRKPRVVKFDHAVRTAA